MTTNENLFTVSTKPLFLKGDKETKFHATVRDDSGAALGIVSDRYAIIQNEDLLDGVESTFKSCSLSMATRSLHYTEDGARLLAKYDFRDKEFKSANRGDAIGFQMVVKNSFDGSGPASLGLSLLRLVCKNGMVRSEAQHRLYKVHRGQPDLTEIQAKVQLIAAGFEAAVTSVLKLSNIRITQEQGETFLKAAQARGDLPRWTVKAALPIWDSPTHVEDKSRNLWNLYNAVTQALTHDAPEKRFEAAYRVNANAGQLFERAKTDLKALLVLPS